MDLREHGEAVYRSKRPTDVSWYQAEAALSTRLIQEPVPVPAAAIIDGGGGASVLAAQLRARGYLNLTVLDLSSAAITAARARLGADARPFAGSRPTSSPPACRQAAMRCGITGRCSTSSRTRALVSDTSRRSGTRCGPGAT